MTTRTTEPRYRPIRANALSSFRPPAATRTHLKSTSTSQTNYKPIKVIGKGAFGVVFTARSSNGEIVAIKKVLQDPHFKNREYDTLTMIRHPNCIAMKSAYKTEKDRKVYLNIVMEYLPLSLSQYLSNYMDQRMFPPLIMTKLFGFQLFCGLHYLHSKGICHRDIKPANVLVNPTTGELKICDFGSAKIIQEGDRSVSYIASRFYRAPELVFDCQTYSNSIDIWAAGCVLVELSNSGISMFQGKTSAGQLFEIAKLLGRPTEEDMESFEHNAEFELPYLPTETLEQKLPKYVPPEMIDLLKKIFVYNPRHRPSALQCMQHPFFDELFVRGRLLPNKMPLPRLIRNPPILPF